MKTKLQVDYRLIQLTKRLLTNEELSELADNGVYGIGSEKRLIIESDGENHRQGESDFVSRIHRFIIDCGRRIDFSIFQFQARSHGPHLDIT